MDVSATAPELAPVTAELLRRISTMGSDACTELLYQLDAYAQLDRRKRSIVDAYTECFNRKTAAKTAQTPVGNRVLASADVTAAIHQRLQKQEAKSILKAEYVREYIMSVLELCPTDYFRPAPEGGWLIGEDDYYSLPSEVKRLIEDVELRIIRGNTYLAVRFVSKSAALAMAARFTLTQKVEATVTAVPWDAIAKQADKELQSPIELRLAEYEQRESAPVPGPAQAGEVAVA